MFSYLWNHPATPGPGSKIRRFHFFFFFFKCYWVYNIPLLRNFYLFVLITLLTKWTWDRFEKLALLCTANSFLKDFINSSSMVVSVDQVKKLQPPPASKTQSNKTALSTTENICIQNIIWRPLTLPKCFDCVMLSNNSRLNWKKFNNPFAFFLSSPQRGSGAERF